MCFAVQNCEASVAAAAVSAAAAAAAAVARPPQQEIHLSLTPILEHEVALTPEQVRLSQALERIISETRSVLSYVSKRQLM